MHVASWKVVVGLLMVVNGLAFVGQGWLFNDTTAALRIHRDIAPHADPGFVDFKVGAWAVAGLAFVVAGLGLLTGRREWLPAVVVGVLLVDGLYVAQFWMWGSAYPGVWAGFATFGALALLYAFVCRHVWIATSDLG